MQNRPKYKNTKVVVDGIKFDSKMERNVYERILILGLELGKDFCVHPKFILQDKFIVNGKKMRVVDYTADFVIYSNDRTKKFVIDVKGMETSVFKIKKKLYAYRYNDEIITIKSVKHFNEWALTVWDELFPLPF